MVFKTISYLTNRIKMGKYLLKETRFVNPWVSLDVDEHSSYRMKVIHIFFQTYPHIQSA